ncbi:MAG: secondary thiamine-phosphate synthase enzyme YjbQ [Paracoccaceae bacterium]|jgi:secondary thiamine-phosphate synthase enzyme|nr:secondary thiamine-phosphate synthase enzyme YjbQ [Paracoccaceae bacterium]MDG1677324.1 secondary thiamine-phosphate synthase enzyme YjbQ [Paracoccaceae bacterium]
MKINNFIVLTNGPGLYEVTTQVAKWLEGNGLLTLLVKHTSASLLIQENADPEVKFDFIQYLEKLVPPSSSPEMSYLTHTYEGPDDMPAHIKSGLLPTTLSIPVVNGKMTLGTWQGIYLVEHRASPRKREIAASLLLA